LHAGIGHTLGLLRSRRLKIRPTTQVVQEALDKPRNIHFKGVTDLVTDTDRASEDAILKVIFFFGCVFASSAQHSKPLLARDGMQVRTRAHMAGPGSAETGQLLTRQYCKKKCHFRCFKRRCQTMASLVRKVVCLATQTLNTCGA